MDRIWKSSQHTQAHMSNIQRQVATVTFHCAHSFACLLPKKSNLYSFIYLFSTHLLPKMNYGEDKGRHYEEMMLMKTSKKVFLEAKPRVPVLVKWNFFFMGVQERKKNIFRFWVYIKSCHKICHVQQLFSIAELSS